MTKKFLLILIIVAILVSCDNSVQLEEVSQGKNLTESELEIVNLLEKAIQNNEFNELEQLFTSELKDKWHMLDDDSKNIIEKIKEIETITPVANEKEIEFLIIGKVRDVSGIIKFTTDSQIEELNFTIDGEELLRFDKDKITQHISSIVREIISDINANNYENLFNMFVEQPLDHKGERIESADKFEKYIHRVISDHHMVTFSKGEEFEVEVDGDSVMVKIDLGQKTKESLPITLILEYNNKWQVVELKFDYLQQIYRNKLIDTKYDYKLTDYYDPAVRGKLSNNYRTKNSKFHNAALINAFQFYNRFDDDDFDVLYSYMTDRAIKNISVNDYTDYIRLMKKRNGLQAISNKEIVRSKVTLFYGQPHYTCEINVPTDDPELLVSVFTDMSLKPKSLELDMNESVIENVYISRAYKTSLYPLTKEEIKERNQQQTRKVNDLIKALKYQDFRTLNEIDLNKGNLSFEESVQLYKYQEAVIGSFDGMFHKKKAVQNIENTIMRHEYIISSKSDILGKLLIDFNRDNDIISYNVSRIFTDGGEDEPAN